MVQVRTSRQRQGEHHGRTGTPRTESQIDLGRIGRRVFEQASGGHLAAEPGEMTLHVMVREHPRVVSTHRSDRPARGVDDRSQLRPGPRRLEVGEVEGGMQLAGADIRGEPVRRVDPGLGDEDPVAVIGIGDGAPFSIDLAQAVPIVVRVMTGRMPDRERFPVVGIDEVRQRRVLDQAVRDVDSEAVDTAVEPEPQNVDELVSNVAVGPVEIWLGHIEQVQIPLAGGAVTLGHAGPTGTTEQAAPVVGRQVARGSAAGPEQVARPLPRARSSSDGRCEPPMPV